MGLWLKRLPTADSASLPTVLVAAMPRYERGCQEKKFSGPSGRCGCGDLHPALGPHGQVCLCRGFPRRERFGVHDQRHHGRADAHSGIAFPRWSISDIRGGGSHGQVRLCGECGEWLPRRYFGVYDQRHDGRADVHPGIALRCRVRTGVRGGGPHGEVCCHPVIKLSGTACESKTEA
jgi:hypothetical protein